MSIRHINSHTMSIIYSMTLYTINTYISYETINNNVSDIIIISTIEYTLLHKVIIRISSIS